ncbi:hypothetical protein B5P45_21190 [Phyllobacterium zundukense]|uniref:Alpha/beta hydrolase n=1 Tax=Phyllobacterium zundukense TaxID=1867719 RepID=A0A2N9VUF3_9HYPH|nr:hypothetical protein BLM14_16910 [Phyllobacterium zundukense]PIO43121.1 hypothetical protein B5P45_21190 [Phyllobacterium zundukense]
MHGHHGPQFDNYQGYNYLAEELADHGYIVLSIDANAINGETLTASGGDASSHSRAQLVLGTLDRLRQINENGQLEKDGKTPGLLNPLKGKMDFSRIGIMGHSRGGQAVSNTILFNKTRRGVTKKQLKDALKANPDAFRFAYPFAYTLLADAVIPRAGTRPASIDEAKFKIAAETYNLFYAAGSKYANGKDAETYAFKGAFMLAPTDFAGNSGLDQVPLANLLPSCDGDVDNLQGARAYDHNRFGPAGDTAPRYQILVRGANHNYYNTIWTNDDYFGKFDVAEYFVPVSNEYCEPRRKDTVRLNEEDQRRGGKFIINSFMRYHVGGEQNFGYYWNGTEQLPPEACPVGDEVCDERAVLTVQTNGGNAKLIHRFNQTDSLTRNALGNAATFSGFDKNGIASCTMPLGETTIGTCSPQLLAGFAYAGSSNSGGFLSIADHAELSWSKTDPSKQGASIVEDITGLSAAGYDSLTFRIAVVRPMGQEVEVTLSDGKETATVKASDFSDALYNAPRKKKGGDVPKDKDLPLIDDTADKPYADGQVRMLNMVAIPLQAFVKVDMTNLKKLELTFPKESGKVAIADIELQNLGRDNPTVTVASKQ